MLWLMVFGGMVFLPALKPIQTHRILSSLTDKKGRELNRRNVLTFRNVNLKAQNIKLYTHTHTCIFGPTFAIALNISLH